MDFAFKNEIEVLRNTLAESADSLSDVKIAADLLADSHPEDAWLCAEIGGVFDSNGFEHEACIWYERALRFGFDAFPEKDAPHFCVWYGSTLRNVRRLSDSERVLRSALERWPQFSALQFFLALTLLSQGRGMEAFAALAEFHVAGWDDSIKEYGRAVESYLNEELRPAAQGLTLACCRLSVRDVAASVQWYAKVLDTKPEISDDNFALFRLGASVLEIARSDDKNPDVMGGAVSYWSTPDLNGWIERFKAHGATIYRGPLPVEVEGMTICQLRDPFGSLFGIRGFAAQRGGEA